MFRITKAHTKVLIRVELVSCLGIYLRIYIIDFTCDAEQVGSIRPVSASLILPVEPKPLPPPPPCFADSVKILRSAARTLPSIPCVCNYTAIISLPSMFNILIWSNKSNKRNQKLKHGRTQWDRPKFKVTTFLLPSCPIRDLYWSPPPGGRQEPSLQSVALPTPASGQVPCCWFACLLFWPRTSSSSSTIVSPKNLWCPACFLSLFHQLERINLSAAQTLRAAFIKVGEYPVTSALRFCCSTSHTLLFSLFTLRFPVFKCSCSYFRLTAAQMVGSRVLVWLPLNESQDTQLF